MTVAKMNEKKIMKIDAVLFDLIIIGFFILLAVMSLGCNPRARSIPLALGIVGSAMMFAQLLVDVSARARSKLRFVSESGLLSAERKAQDKEFGTPKEQTAAAPDQIAPSSGDEVQEGVFHWWRAFRVILWLVGFIVLLTYTHYLVAVSAFLALMTKFEARETWKRAIILTICVDVSIYLLFDVLLQAQL
ncbi:MAG: tripartite tricarboxylate transporter TctB family protein [Desulfobacteraceae bacterium]|nr:tripartite tricarboxylate transporter TctB family protein [Desulfobacteraceae bacterium]